MSTEVGDGALARAQFDGTVGLRTARRDDDADGSEVGLGARGLARPWDLLSAVRFTVRTVAPFVLADVLSLAIVAWAAQAAVRALWVDPGLASPWWGTLALLPLMGGYWLSGIYSEIWIHPAIEFRQLTHVNTVGLLCAAAPA